MKMLSLVFAALLFTVHQATAEAVPLHDVEISKVENILEQRDYATVLNDLKQFNTDTRTLQTAVNNYNGGLAAAGPIQTAFNNVEKDINQTIIDTQNSAVTTSAQAQALADYINNTLEPSVSAAITAIINKKSQFASSGLQSTVCTGLKRILADLNRLCPAYIAKVPSANQSAASAACEKLKADVQRGVTAFCGSTTTRSRQRRGTINKSNHAPLNKRDYPTVFSDFQLLNDDTTRLKQNTTNWNGTLAGWVPIYQSLQALERDANKTTADITSATTPATLTAAQSQQLLTYFTNTFEPNLSATVNVLLGRRQQFAADGLTSSTCQSFRKLATAFGNVCAAYVARNQAGSARDSAQSICGKISADLQRGVTGFCGS